MTSLVRSARPDDLDGLRARSRDLEAVLGERVADMTRVKSALDAFKIRYRQEVGLLHEQLEDLEYEIAVAEGEVAAGERPSARIAGDPLNTSRPESAPKLTSDAARKLFRDVAKIIHPDLAGDEAARDRRHDLMIEANRAYELGDVDQLRLILQAWEKSPEAVQGSDPESVRLRLERRIAQIEEQLELLTSDLVALKDSPLWRLKAMVDESAARGKDLVRDMVRRLKRDILVATNRLEAMRPPDR